MVVMEAPLVGGTMGSVLLAAGAEAEALGNVVWAAKVGLAVLKVLTVPEILYFGKMLSDWLFIEKKNNDSVRLRGRRINNAEGARLSQDTVEVLSILDQVDTETAASRPSTARRVHLLRARRAINQGCKNLRLKATDLLQKSVTAWERRSMHGMAVHSDVLGWWAPRWSWGGQCQHAAR
jgi:hypothetical protein